MRVTILFLLLSTLSFGQSDTTTLFGEEIMAYVILGYRINKTPDLIILDHGGVKIEEDSTAFIVTGYNHNHPFVVVAYKCNGDTIFPKRYNFRFINHPDPVIRWRKQDPDSKTVHIHKDSLEQLRDFYVVTPHRDSVRLKWNVISGRVFMPGMTGAPPTFGNTTKLPQEFIDTLKTRGDTIPFAISCTVRGIDGIARQIGGTIEVIKLEGEAYERHIDPNYDYHHYTDTILFTKSGVKTGDTLHLAGPARKTYLGIPQRKYDFYVKLENSSNIAYCYDPPPTLIPAGKDIYYIEKYTSKGDYELIYYLDHKVTERLPFYIE